MTSVCHLTPATRKAHSAFMTNYPGRVRATELIIDEGRIFALPGDVGTVFDAETYEDGSRALTVAFPSAPCATTVFLGENAVTLLSVVREA
jgi:hypothetical protein